MNLDLRSRNLVFSPEYPYLFHIRIRIQLTREVGSIMPEPIFSRAHRRWVESPTSKKCVITPTCNLHVKFTSSQSTSCNPLWLNWPQILRNSVSQPSKWQGQKESPKHSWFTSSKWTEPLFECLKPWTLSLIFSGGNISRKEITENIDLPQVPMRTFCFRPSSLLAFILKIWHLITAKGLS